MFCEFVEKTLQRYDELNLNIDSFRLWTYGYCNPAHNIYSLINKWITKALKMCATGIDLKIYYQFTTFTLPRELFGSENLIRLSVSGCKIGTGADGKVCCSRLKSLTLDNVIVEGDIISDIISSCHWIENLSLSPYNNNNGVAFSPFTDYVKQNVVSVVDSPFKKLRCLLLCKIEVHTLFFNDFSSKFPCLKDLSLDNCRGYKGIQISTPSLECISFTQDKMIRVKFDVPNIRKFHFSGLSLPSLSFKPKPSNWESNISIRYYRSPSAAWFLKLNKLLAELSLSKISLSLEMCFGKRFDSREDMKGLPKHEVENLMIPCPKWNCPDLLDGLFWCCRPIYVTQEWCDYRMRNNEFMEFVYKRVMQEVSLNCCIANQSMPRECGLMGVDVEFFDETISAWRPRLLDSVTSPGADERRIRLHLRWGC